MTDKNFFQELPKLTSDQLDQKYTELLKKLNIASRFAMAQAVIDQMTYLMDAILDEKDRRIQEERKKTEPASNSIIIETDPIPVYTIDDIKDLFL
jgi:hypothetical protein